MGGSRSDLPLTCARTPALSGFTGSALSDSHAPSGQQVLPRPPRPSANAVIRGDQLQARRALRPRRTRVAKRPPPPSRWRPVRQRRTRHWGRPYREWLSRQGCLSGFRVSTLWRALLEGEGPQRACRRDRWADADGPRHAELGGDQAETDRSEAQPDVDGGAGTPALRRRAGIINNSTSAPSPPSLHGPDSWRGCLRALHEGPRFCARMPRPLRKRITQLAQIS